MSTDFSTELAAPDLRIAAVSHGWSLHVRNAALLASAYFAIAGVSHALAPGDDVDGFFWLPAGLLLSALLLTSRAEWPALFAGAFLGDAAFSMTHDLDPGTIAIRFGVTGLQALIGATAVQRFLEPFRMASPRDLLWFLFLSALIAPAIGALIAPAIGALAGAGCLQGFPWTESFEQALFYRWGSSSIGVLVLAPFILAWREPPDPGLRLHQATRRVEAAVLMVATVVVVSFAFQFGRGLASPLRLLLAAPVIWAGLRFGLRGASAVNLAMALSMAVFTGTAMPGATVAALHLVQIGPAQTLLALLVVIGLKLALVIQQSREQLAALGRSEDFFRAVIEDQTEMIVRWSPDGTRTFVNSAYCRAMDLPGTSLLGTSFFPTMSDDGRERIRAKILSLTRECPVAIDVHHCVRGGDGKRWQEWIDRGIFDDQGQLVEVQSTGRDITQRVTDEQEIRRLSRLYASLSAVNQAVLTEDTAEAFLDVTCRILIEEGGLLLSTVARADRDLGLIEPVARAGAAARFLDRIRVRLGDTAAERGPVATCIHEGVAYICRDVALDPRTIAWRDGLRSSGLRSSAAFPIQGTNAVWGALSVYSGETEYFGDKEVRLLEEIAGNIRFALDRFARETSRRETEQALRESEERFRMAMEFSPMGMAIVATDGRWMEVNPSLCRIVGYDREELLRLDFQAVTHPDDLAADVEKVQQVLSRRIDSYRMEKRYVRKSGEDIWVQLDVVLVRTLEGAPAYFLSKVQDITERRDVERRILELNATLEKRVAERTRELELANQELEAFSASVSHDLRAPLRAIDGFSQMLAREHLDPEDTEGQADLARIRSAAHRMEECINGMLRLARLPRGPLQRESVDLSAIAHEAIDALKLEHPERLVRVSISPGLVARGNATLLRAVLENLLANAWKFTSRVPDAEIGFGIEERDGEEMFFVSDNGAGFDMKHAGRLFQAFHRLHDEREFPGTGIGLVTVQRIIHRYGGRIEVQSRINAGTSFFFTIPDNDDESETKAA